MALPLAFLCQHGPMLTMHVLKWHVPQHILTVHIMPHTVQQLLQPRYAGYEEK